MPLSAQQIIDLLRLEPLPREGGCFRLTHRAQNMTAGRPLYNAIYYFLEGAAFSHLHRLAQDEIYHFYAGSPVEMLCLMPDGKGERRLLGNDLESGQRPQILVPGGCWQGARLLAGGWALMGTTLSPAWEERDYEHGGAAALTRQYPRFGDLIAQLTRDQV
ncbi:MAG: cupin domain-containing protein [Candidatus Accumulibacter sp.]|jgi:predicted cupin superfamily sugar epimerase|nr:cupin domain-containing protein [Accumulibacter sp.]